MRTIVRLRDYAPENCILLAKVDRAGCVRLRLRGPAIIFRDDLMVLQIPAIVHVPALWLPAMEIPIVSPKVSTIKW